MTNKKGEWYDVLNWCIYIFLIFFISFVICASIAHYNLEKAKKNSCTKIDMEYYETQDSVFCVSENGDAHFVKIDCEGFIRYDCTARIISIGDVRIK